MAYSRHQVQYKNPEGFPGTASVSLACVLALRVTLIGGTMSTVLGGQLWCKAKSSEDIDQLYSSVKVAVIDVQTCIVLDVVKLIENRNCEKVVKKAMTKLARLCLCKEGTEVNSVTLERI